MATDATIIECVAAPGCVRIPKQATAGSAGADLYAGAPCERAPWLRVTDDGDDIEIVSLPRGVYRLHSLERVTVPVGVRVAIPDGFEGQIRPRSGLARRHGLTVANAPGTIDSDYRGVVAVCLVNLGRQTVELRPGDRIAQLVIAPVAAVEYWEVDFIDHTARGSGGFGSTGTRGLPAC